MPTRSPRIYLDYNATAPAIPGALAVALAAIEAGGNPSSVHGEGRGARGFVETARGQVAGLLGCRPDAICFTSGGTEAANMALGSVALEGGASLRRLLVGASEHAAVLHGHGFEDRAAIVPIRCDGIMDLDALREAVARSGPAVLALQAANNETGVIQPVRQAAEIVRAGGGILVCDAVQAAGRIPCDQQTLGADVVLLSGHKLGGIIGAGAVAIVNDKIRLAPVLRGGGQERGLRAGTENVPAIAAFGASAQAARFAPDAKRLVGLRYDFERGLREIAADVVIFGQTALRLPNTSAFAVPDVSAEQLMMALDLGGVAVSSGSACSSGKVGRSHVLEAMGVPPDLRIGAIRVSFGWRSSASDVDGVLAVLQTTLKRFRRRIRSAA